MKNTDEFILHKCDSGVVIGLWFYKKEEKDAVAELICALKEQTLNDVRAPSAGGEGQAPFSYAAATGPATAAAPAKENVSPGPRPYLPPPPSRGFALAFALAGPIYMQLLTGRCGRSPPSSRCVEKEKEQEEPEAEAEAGPEPAS